MTTDDWALVELGDPERSMPKAELARRAAALAGFFSTEGVDAGDRVAYLLDNSIPVFEIAGACHLLGAAAVPINYHFQADEVRYILEDSGAKAVVTSGAHVDVVARAADGVTSVGGRRLVLRGAHEGFLDYDEASRAPRRGPLPRDPLPARSSTPPEPPVTPRAWCAPRPDPRPRSDTSRRSGTSVSSERHRPTW